MPILLALFWLSLMALSAAAARWGEWPERTTAALYVAAAALTSLVRPSFSLRYAHVELSVLAVDLSLLVGLTLVAVRCGQWWILCAAALQFLTVLSHVAKTLNPDLWRLGYQIMATWSALPALLLLGAGIAARAASRPPKSSGTSPGS